jgi:hypothetical protein
MRGLFGEQPFSPHLAVPRDAATPRPPDAGPRRYVVGEPAPVEPPLDTLVPPRPSVAGQRAADHIIL